MEYLDVVDENNNLTGKTEERDIIHRNGIWHREIEVWIMNEQGEVLIQKRAANKKQQPNKWALCAGHIDAGETEESSAIREMEEEIGAKVSRKDLQFIMIFKDKTELLEDNIKDNNYKYTYFWKINMKLDEYKIQLEELSKIKYITMEDLEMIVKNQEEEYTFSSKAYMPKIIEELKKRK